MYVCMYVWIEEKESATMKHAVIPIPSSAFHDGPSDTIPVTRAPSPGSGSTSRSCWAVSGADVMSVLEGCGSLARRGLWEMYLRLVGSRVGQLGHDMHGIV
jgi:hypothetical protein